MTDSSPDAALRRLFGRAFLVELRRGDLEAAKLFARAFLTRRIGSMDAPLIVPALARGAPQ
ncbi:MAG TPA: hypothetical protein VJ224_02820 [Thermoplasmata archaeon]|nr:hypothetical protein [Thermoplasmata archaeon]